MQIITSEEQFADAIAKDEYTVMKFITTWCPDCKNLNRFIDEIIALHTEKNWFEINAEEFPELSERYEVRGVPSLLVYKKGEKIAHLHSKFAKTKKQILDFLATI
ncbi:thioredoxin family protein [Sulfoacidibacillus thermotolerans]|uniref:Thiol reductase thioredoxin n=1 Tax=Sulfoacidibacillus thermotolerans TaxID=1765684 RepID=A0A2U3DBA1_SULT2|nr:thioredoxin family protein [Sulfoacidibacillus thermotolerans]PWI58557.1 thiol reductase thioredoxin [Sulfoacidibacillus thermotolerans]